MPTIAYERTLNAWLIREDKVLAAAVTDASSKIDVFALARTLERSPISVLLRLRTSERCEKLATDLERRGLWLDLDGGRDEECEFWGLALAGVPLSMAWRWCVDDSDQGGVVSDSVRPTLSVIESAMRTADQRPAMALVRDAGLMFADVLQLEALGVLVAEGLASTLQARQKVVERFDVPTPKVVAQAVFGVLPGLADAAVFDGVRLVFKKGGARRGATANSNPRAPRAAASTPTLGATGKRTYQRKRKSSSKSTKSAGSKSTWWSKYKRAAKTAAAKTGYSGRGRGSGRNSDIIPEEQYEISDGPRVIEYI